MSKRKYGNIKKQESGREILGDIAPKFAELNDEFLFGKVWSREQELSLRDRILNKISDFFSAGLYPQLKPHLQLGKEHGLIKK